MMLSLRNANKGHRLIQYIKHKVRNILTKQITVLAVDYTDPATQIGQVLVHGSAKIKLAEHCVIKLPGPTIIGLL